MRWEARLPRWLEPGESIDVYAPADELREAHKEHGVAFDDMVPWAGTGDGRKFRASKGVPLAD
jgi:hypothetical protein